MAQARFPLLACVLRNPKILKARPAANLFLLRYLRKFRAREVGGNVILHSHLPPLNSRAYSRFVDEHLLEKRPGPSHAQIGLTNACPQRCEYCYNRERQGVAMDAAKIRETISRLKEMGVFWIGLTGGEPLLQPEIVSIVAEASRDCAVKLFTTGCGLKPGLAGELKSAGMFSVSVSLDHWTAEVHDRVRSYPGAFRTALAALETFKSAGLHVGVSAVLSREMIRAGETETLLSFLRSLDVDEAWLSEAKPAGRAFWKPDCVIRDEDRNALIALQDRENKKSGMTINYLGHFESPGHFGCNAGGKMIYVDAFGEVSPCVFAPLTFGNVREKDVRDIWSGMQAAFAPDSKCFVNHNYALFEKYYAGQIPLGPSESLALMKDVRFGRPGRFLEALDGQRRSLA